MSRGVADPERAAPDITDTTQKNQGVTFRGFWPHRVIRRGDAVRPLPPHARSLSDLTFEVGDARLSLSDYMARRRTDGLLILKRGEVALERYGIIIRSAVNLNRFLGGRPPGFLCHEKRTGRFHILT